MPSSRYIDLTLGASGSTYTAPANGYFISSGNFGQGDGYIDLINNTKRGIGTVAKSSSNNWSFHVFVPCQKGDQVAVYYVGDSNLTFLYAEGEN